MEARDDSYQALRHRIVLISRMDRLEEIYRVGFSDHVRLVVRPGRLASGNRGTENGNNHIFY